MICIMGPSVISVSLLMTQTGDWLMQQRGVMPSQGMRGSTNGLAGPSHNLTQGSGKPGTWAVTIPKGIRNHQEHWALTWGSCWTPKGTRASNAFSVGDTDVLGCIWRSGARRRRETILPLYSALGGAQQECCIQLWATPTQTHWRKWPGLCRTHHRGKGWQHWQHPAYSRKDSGGISSMGSNSWKTHAKIQSGSLQWCPVTGQEVMGTGWNTEGFIWISGKISSFEVTVKGTWSREIVELKPDAWFQQIMTEICAVSLSGGVRRNRWRQQSETNMVFWTEFWNTALSNSTFLKETTVFLFAFSHYSSNSSKSMKQQEAKF